MPQVFDPQKNIRKRNNRLPSAFISADEMINLNPSQPPAIMFLWTLKEHIEILLVFLMLFRQ